MRTAFSVVRMSFSRGENDVAFLDRPWSAKTPRSLAILYVGENPAFRVLAIPSSRTRRIIPVSREKSRIRVPRLERVGIVIGFTPEQCARYGAELRQAAERYYRLNGMAVPAEVQTILDEMSSFRRAWTVKNNGEQGGNSTETVSSRNGQFSAPCTMTTGEAASQLRMSVQSVRRHCRTGRLPARRIGNDWRINPEDLSDFMLDRG